MRRLYVLPKAVLLSRMDLGGGKSVNMIDLFHPATGGHYIDLPGGLVVLAADFHRDMCEEIFHGHPQVAVLPHSVYEPTKTVKQAMSDPLKKVQQHHVDALAHIGVKDAHTTAEVSAITAAIHPLVKAHSVT